MDDFVFRIEELPKELIKRVFCCCVISSLCTVKDIAWICSLNAVSKTIQPLVADVMSAGVTTINTSTQTKLSEHLFFKMVLPNLTNVITVNGLWIHHKPENPDDDSTTLNTNSVGLGLFKSFLQRNPNIQYLLLYDGSFTGVPEVTELFDAVIANSKKVALLYTESEIPNSLCKNNFLLQLNTLPNLQEVSFPNTGRLSRMLKRRSLEICAKSELGIVHETTHQLVDGIYKWDHNIISNYVINNNKKNKSNDNNEDDYDDYRSDSDEE